MRADLHTHSQRSDGTDSPAGVMQAAAAAGLDVVALTDHDSAAGWAEAADAARVAGIGFLPGMEISCVLEGRAVHLLAYGVDPEHAGLHDELSAVLAGRTSRLPAILSQLSSLGISVSEEDIRAVSGHATAVGRPHVADALVASGHVADRTEAFDRYLSPGRPAYVNRRSAPLRTMLGLVASAGGVSVVAHPWARASRRVLTPDTVASLVADGLTGLEAWHQDHSAEDAAQLAMLAGDLNLVATGASDYHGTGKVNHELGCHTTPPAQFEQLLERMVVAGDAARQRDPSVRPTPWCRPAPGPR
ncbi:MAG: error-prone polymerase [Nocardioidaceae bacterium]|nr:error-prone polymerase [Nocardioidaceae bacterium]